MSDSSGESFDRDSEGVEENDDEVYSEDVSENEEEIDSEEKVGESREDFNTETNKVDEGGASEEFQESENGVGSEEEADENDDAIDDEEDDRTDKNEQYSDSEAKEEEEEDVDQDESENGEEELDENDLDLDANDDNPGIDPENEEQDLESKEADDGEEAVEEEWDGDPDLESDAAAPEDGTDKKFSAMQAATTRLEAARQNFLKQKERFEQAHKTLLEAEAVYKSARCEKNREIKKQKIKLPRAKLSKDEVNKKYVKLLIEASKVGSVKKVRMILRVMAELELDIWKTDKFGCTALHWACRNTNSVKLVRALIEAGIDVDVQSGMNDDEPGWTPLMEAANKGNSRILKELLDNNCDLWTTDWYTGSNALDYAKVHGHKKCVRLLKKKMRIPLDEEERAKPVEEETYSLPRSPQRYGAVGVGSLSYAEWKEINSSK